jgi:ribosome maturation factor RimP
MKGGRHQELITALETLSRKVVSGLGLELVELTLRGSSTRRVLRVDIDRAGPRGVDVDDCQRVSGALGEALDETDLLQDRYVLEVSSPGVDRPIVTADDFRRNTGRRVVIRTHESIAGRTRFTGVLTGCRDDRVGLEDDQDGATEIGLSAIAEARQEIGF